MKFPIFQLERNQSLYENQVEINLTESGVHPFRLCDLLTPAEIGELAQLPIGYGHTEGSPELRQAIAKWYPGASRENVLVTTGASEANLLGMWTAVDAPDEIIVVTPNFMQIAGAAKAMGARVRTVPLREADGWRLRQEDLLRCLTPRTRMIAVCNPNNPTGLCLSEGERRLLVRAAESAQAWLLVDEIYRGAELGDHPETQSMWGDSPRVIIVAGLSKAFAHPGLRIGWIVAPAEFIEQAMQRQDYTTIGSNVLGQFIAALLLQPERREHVFRRNRTILTANLAIAEDWAIKRARQLNLISPQAGGMAWMRYYADIKSDKLSRKLRNEAGVFVVAGSWFGIENCLRIGIGGEQAKLVAGLGRLGELLDQLPVPATARL